MTATVMLLQTEDLLVYSLHHSGLYELRLMLLKDKMNECQDRKIKMTVFYLEHDNIKSTRRTFHIVYLGTETNSVKK